jgi:hypothetical protein
MANERKSKAGWLERRRERKRDSPEKLAERHTPKGGAVDKMLKLGGVERESRFKK